MNPELSTNELLQLIGSAHADALFEIDRAHLSYGVHHRFAHNTTIYSLAGLREIAVQLSARAQAAEAADALVEPTEEQAARTAALACAAAVLGEKVREFAAEVAEAKARRAADPLAVAEEANARQRTETPSRAAWYRRGQME